MADNTRILKQVDDWKKAHKGYSEDELTKATLAFSAGAASAKESTGTGDSSNYIAKILKASADTDQYASVNSNQTIQDFAKNYSEAKKEGDSPISQFFSGLKGVAGDQGETYAKEQVYMLRQINAEMGLTGQFSKDFRDSLNETIPGLQKLGLGVTDVVESTKEMVDNSGRFAFISADSQVKAAQIATAFGMSMKELAGSYKSFEDVGIGAVGAAEAIGEAGKNSLELGLQSQKTIKGLQENVEKLNMFGFQKGIRGLEEMVRKSTEFRMSVDSVFQVADKVFSPEGALEMAANLQVVGGAMGALNNPLEMMYMATNNVEGLQDAIFKSTESLATFNNETGRFEVVGVNLRKAKDMADATGISLSELTKGAIAGNERMQAMNDMSGIDVPEETKRFLTNISQMKDGEMTIQIQDAAMRKKLGMGDQVEMKLSDMSNEMATELKKYQDEFKTMNPEDIVRQQANAVQNIMKDVNYMLGVMRIQGAKAGDAGAEALFGLDSKDLGTFISEQGDKGSDWVSEFLTNGMSGITASIKSSNESAKKIAEAQKSSNDEKSKPTNKTTTVIELKHTSDSTMGAYQRQLQSNPQYWNDLMKSDPRSYTP